VKKEGLAPKGEPANAGICEGRAGAYSMCETARGAMPPKGDPIRALPERWAILFPPGEVAEWLKAAPC
jgi:hypothetical protein